MRGIQFTIASAAPLVLGGMAVGLGFKAGLFNIGAQGQFLIGAMGSAAVGAWIGGASAWVAVPIAVLSGALFGAAWGFIPGALKAWTGAHEVVTTIMLNFIAGAVIGYLITGPLEAPGYNFSRTGDLGNAALPLIPGTNLHIGVLIAFGLVPVVWWFLWRSTLGFEIRTVGANPDAARYAGMRPAFLTILTMSLCGLLAGLAGAGQILGISGFMTASYGDLDRLRLDLGRPARAREPVRHRRGGTAVRRHAGGVGIDADPGRDSGRDHRRHPGHDPPVPRL